MKLFVYHIITGILFINSCSQIDKKSTCKIKTEYYPSKNDSKKRVEYIYEADIITNEKCGSFVWLFENGDTLETAYFNNGKLNGTVKNYFENGRLQLECEYSDDLANGVSLEYYENSKLRCKLIYQMDKLWSIEAVNDSSGNSLDFGKLVNGNGFVKTFYPNGKVETEGNYSEGVKDGYWRFYTDNGIIGDSVFYENGFGPYSLTIENGY